MTNRGNPLALNIRFAQFFAALPANERRDLDALLKRYLTSLCDLFNRGEIKVSDLMISGQGFESWFAQISPDWKEVLDSHLNFDQKEVIYQSNHQAYQGLISWIDQFYLRLIDRND